MTSNEDKIALDWIRSIESARGQVRETDLFPLLREWVTRAQPKAILDIGCGQGVCSDKIDLEGRTYTGIELSRLLVARAKELYPQANRQFLVGDAYALACADESIDAAFSVSVWHLLADLQRAALELSRVLKPGGYFFIVSANPATYEAWKALYLETKLNGKRLEGTAKLADGTFVHETLYLHSLDEISDSFQQAGLVDRTVSTFRPYEKGGGQGIYLTVQGRKRGGWPALSERGIPIP